MRSSSESSSAFTVSSERGRELLVLRLAGEFDVSAVGGFERAAKAVPSDQALPLVVDVTSAPTG